jgi:hypothetical protein
LKDVVAGTANYNTTYIDASRSGVVPKSRWAQSLLNNIKNGTAIVKGVFVYDLSRRYTSRMPTRPPIRLSYAGTQAFGFATALNCNSKKKKIGWER